MHCPKRGARWPRIERGEIKLQSVKLRQYRTKCFARKKGERVAKYERESLHGEKRGISFHFLAGLIVLSEMELQLVIDIKMIFYTQLVLASLRVFILKYSF